MTARFRCLLFPAAVTTLTLALTSCSQTPPPAPDTRAADERAIRTACDNITKAFNDGDVDRVLRNYTDDLVFMGDDSPLIQGREAAKTYLEKALTAKPSFSFTVTKVEVSKSGDVAYDWGTGTMTTKDKKGKAAEGTFKSLSAWKKQADGTWRITADTMIPDPPPAAPVAKKAPAHTRAGKHSKR